MKKSTGVYIINEKNEVLLALKTRVVGIGKRFPYGGKVDPGESFPTCAKRETKEETGGKIDPSLGIDIEEEDLIPGAFIDFYRGKEKPSEPLFQAIFYTCYKHKGKAKETDEMLDPQWFDIENLPEHEMKEGDELFVKQIIAGQKLKGWIWFDEDGTLIDSSIVESTTKELLELTKTAA